MRVFVTGATGFKNDHVAHGVDISSTGVSANLARPVPGPY